MRLKEFFIKFNKLRKKPIFLILQAILSRIPFHPIKMARFYELHFDGTPIHIGTKDCAEIKKGSFNDINELVCCQNKRDIFLKRFKSGDYCLLAVVDGKVVGYEWFCVGSKHIEERYGYEIPIPDNAIYAYDAYVLPNYRKQGIWRQLLFACSELMNKYGKKRITSFVDYGNDLSLNAHRRYGFSQIKSILFVSFFGLKFSRCNAINELREKHEYNIKRD